MDTRVRVPTKENSLNPDAVPVRHQHTTPAVVHNRRRRSPLLHPPAKAAPQARQDVIISPYCPKILQTSKTPLNSFKFCLLRICTYMLRLGKKWKFGGRTKRVQFFVSRDQFCVNSLPLPPPMFCESFTLYSSVIGLYKSYCK